MPELTQRPFGDTGLTVAPLGIGATHSAEVITYLLDQGVNLVDTAQCYGEHEVLLGETIAHRRDEFILVSKCGHHDVLPDGSMRSRAISMADVDRALERLKTDHLDAMLLHSYDRDLLEAGEAVGVLAAAKQAGKIRFAGCSGDNETAALAASMPEVGVIEASISLADQRNIDVLLPVCRERGIAVIAKRPIANGAWRHLAAPDKAGEHVRPYVDRLAAMGLRPADIGLRGEDAWPALALRFNLAVPGLHTAIVSTSSLDHARDNLAAAKDGPLDAEAYQHIRELFRRAEGASGAVWAGLN